MIKSKELKDMDLSKVNATPYKVAKNISMADFDMMNNFINKINEIEDEGVSRFIKELSDNNLIFLTCVFNQLPVRLHAYITAEVMKREPLSVPAEARL